MISLDIWPTRVKFDGVCLDKSKNNSDHVVSQIWVWYFEKKNIFLWRKSYKFEVSLVRIVGHRLGE